MQGYTAEKDDIVKRLHRIEGQVRGIERMVDEDRYCIDILDQISAISTALERVGLRILDGHVNHCVTDALRSVVGGTKVSIDANVNPDILGGLVVKVGSRLFDSSIRSKLQRLQLAMKGVA